jgi:uncharacterized linocin/CFP29 family protein
MNGYLGRDRVWNEHIWSEIDNAVREQVGRIRVAQKVFPSTVVNNVLPVVANAPPLGPGPLMAGDDLFQPFLELSREFVLTPAQVDGEENMHLAPTLARLAAAAIANAEDTILFLGQGSIAGLVIPAGVNVTNQVAGPPGFVAEAIAATAAANSVVNVAGNIIGAVAQGMAGLNGRAQPGPFALFLSPNNYAQAFAPLQLGQLQTPGDQVNRLVTGGFYIVNSLALVPAPNNNIGILVSLGGEPAKIILGADAMAAFTYTDAQGNYHFRVFERIQLVVRDERAFQTLQYP